MKPLAPLSVAVGPVYRGFRIVGTIGGEYWVVKDSTVIARTATPEAARAAIDLVAA